MAPHGHRDRQLPITTPNLRPKADEDAVAPRIGPIRSQSLKTPTIHICKPRKRWLQRSKIKHGASEQVPSLRRRSPSALVADRRSRGRRQRQGLKISARTLLDPQTPQANRLRQVRVGVARGRQKVDQTLNPRWKSRKKQDLSQMRRRKSQLQSLAGVDRRKRPNEPQSANPHLPKNSQIPRPPRQAGSHGNPEERLSLSQSIDSPTPRRLGQMRMPLGTRKKNLLTNCRLGEGPNYPTAEVSILRTC